MQISGARCFDRLVRRVINLNILAEPLLRTQSFNLSALSGCAVGIKYYMCHWGNELALCFGCPPSVFWLVQCPVLQLLRVLPACPIGHQPLTTKTITRESLVIASVLRKQENSEVKKIPSKWDLTPVFPVPPVFLNWWPKLECFGQTSMFVLIPGGVTLLLVYFFLLL